MNWSRLQYIPVLALLLPQLGNATALLETDNYVRFYGATDPRVVYACDHADGSACDGSVVVPGTNWTVNYHAQGSSAFGILKDHAQLTMTGDDTLGGFPSFVSVGARSGYSDSYLITGSTGQGVAQFTFNVSGSTDASANAAAGSLLQYIPIVDGQHEWAQQLNFGVLNGKATVSIPFTFGQAFEGAIYFYALAQVWQFDAPAFADADFSHTAILSGIDVVDAQGAPVDFAITTESGTDYGPGGVLPEPSTALLAGAAFAAMSCVRRRTLRVDRT